MMALRVVMLHYHGECVLTDDLKPLGSSWSAFHTMSIVLEEILSHF